MSNVLYIGSGFMLPLKTQKQYKTKREKATLRINVALVIAYNIPDYSPSLKEVMSRIPARKLGARVFNIPCRIPSVL